MVLPPRLRIVESRTFSYCDALRAVLFPESLEKIGAWAFAKSGLRSVTIPANVRLIGERAFWGCADLASLDMLPGSALELVCRWAFAETGLRGVVFPEQARVVPEVLP